MNQIDGPIRVLQIDDEPDFAEMTATFLERHDDRLRVKTITEERETLEVLGEEEIDCIVSDYQMPAMNSIDLLNAVRSERPNLPFILFTSHGSEAIASEAISAGVSDYLQKSHGTDQFELLATRILHLVDSARTQRTLSERTRRLELAIDNTKSGI